MRDGFSNWSLEICAINEVRNVRFVLDTLMTIDSALMISTIDVI